MTTSFPPDESVASPELLESPPSAPWPPHWADVCESDKCWRIVRDGGKNLGEKVFATGGLLYAAFLLAALWFCIFIQLPAGPANVVLKLCLDLFIETGYALLFCALIYVWWRPRWLGSLVAAILWKLYYLSQFVIRVGDAVIKVAEVGLWVSCGFLALAIGSLLLYLTVCGLL